MARFVLVFLGLLACVYSVCASANNVAVLDTRLAVLNSKAAKKAFAKLEKQIASDRQRLTQIQQEMSALEAQFKKKQASMSASDKKVMQQQAQAKLQEYNQLGQRIQRRIEDSQSQMLTKLMPKLKAGVAKVRQDKQVDVVIDKKYVYAVSGAWDITGLVTEYIDRH